MPSLESSCKLFLSGFGSVINSSETSTMPSTISTPPPETATLGQEQVAVPPLEIVSSQAPVLRLTTEPLPSNLVKMRPKEDYARLLAASVKKNTNERFVVRCCRKTSTLMFRQRFTSESQVIFRIPYTQEHIKTIYLLYALSINTAEFLAYLAANNYEIDETTAHSTPPG